MLLRECLAFLLVFLCCLLFWWCWSQKSLVTRAVVKTKTKLRLSLKWGPSAGWDEVQTKKTKTPKMMSIHGTVILLLVIVEGQLCYSLNHWVQSFGFINAKTVMAPKNNYIRNGWSMKSTMKVWYLHKKWCIRCLVCYMAKTHYKSVIHFLFTRGSYL